MPAWGYKITLHIYVEGPHPGKAIFTAAEAANTALGDAGCTVDFVGASLKEVRDKPVGQVAT